LGSPLRENRTAGFNWGCQYKGTRLASTNQSITFYALWEIIESYITNPVLLTLVKSACLRTETRGGIFYDFHEKGIPMGSPLSPLLGAIALIPLDIAMQNRKDVFYARYMDDWVVLTKSKTSLRNIIKITHQVMNDLKLQLHPMKTYIGKISHGFNILGYYIDPHKILPSQESIRRFHERATALYEQPPNTKRVRRYRGAHDRDISLYPVNEAPPTNQQLQEYFSELLTRASSMPDRVGGHGTVNPPIYMLLKLIFSKLEEFVRSIKHRAPTPSN
jgi:hypothetical protein